MDSPIFKTKVQKIKMIKLIAFLIVAIVFYLIYFFAHLYLPGRHRTKMDVFNDHIFFLALSTCALAFLIYQHIQSTLFLYVYNNKGIISLEIRDRLGKKRLEFESPFRKEFFYNRVRVSAGQAVYEMYICFYKEEKLMLALTANQDDMTKPPPVFVLADLSQKKADIKKKGGEIYDSRKLIQLIENLW